MIIDQPLSLCCLLLSVVYYSIALYFVFMCVLRAFVHMYVTMHVRMCSCVCVCVCARAYVHISLCVCLHVSVCIRVCILTSVCACMLALCQGYHLSLNRQNHTIILV